MSHFSNIISLAALMLGVSQSFAQNTLRLPRIFSDEMVLQREVEVPVWGWTKSGKEVALEFGEISLSTTADDNGKWELILPAQKAGGPYDIQISSGNNQRILRNVWFGEVWLCGGQSNMQYSLKMLGKDSVIAHSENDKIRLFQVPRQLSFLPREDLPYGKWQACKPSSVSDFSAVAYFFAQRITEELGIHVGLINSNYGGSVLETWLSKEAALTIPYYVEAVEDLQRVRQSSLKRTVRKAYKYMRKGMGKLNEKAFQGGTATWARINYDDDNWGEMVLPGLWDEQGLKEFDGSVWFRKSIEIEMLKRDESFTITLGRFDDRARIWFNGERLAEHLSPQHNYVKVAIPKRLLREGTNVVSMRVTDTGGPGGVWGTESNLLLEGTHRSFSLAGNWKFRLSNDNFKLDIPGDHPNDMPTLLHNSMIHPLGPMALRGILWYQGESNSDRGWEYQQLFDLLVKDWRKQFRTDPSFYFVQLANFVPNWYSLNHATWAELREAQRLSLSIPKTGMAVSIDIGDGQDIHPRNKEDVGLRLALIALAKDYNKDIVWSGPSYKSMKIQGDTLRLQFEHTGSGLQARNDGKLLGFEVAGEDRAFAPAEAWIEGDEVLLRCAYINQPIAARYAWRDNPEDANLVNHEGLPASPFRTYDWAWDSKGKVKKYFRFRE